MSEQRRHSWPTSEEKESVDQLSPAEEHPEDCEEHAPEEVHSDPVLWWEIQNDPAIWPENKVAAYRAALRGEPEWWFATSDDPPHAEPPPVRLVTPGPKIR